MRKIDDNDEQIEEVANLLKQLTHADEKEEQQEDEVLEFTELLNERKSEEASAPKEESIEEEELPIEEEIIFDDNKLTVEEDLPDEGDSSEGESEEVDEELEEAEEVEEDEEISETEEDEEEEISETEEDEEEEISEAEEEISDEEEIEDEISDDEEESEEEVEEVEEVLDVEEAEEEAGADEEYEDEEASDVDEAWEEEINTDEDQYEDEYEDDEDSEEDVEPVVVKPPKKRAVKKTSNAARARNNVVTKNEEPEPVKMSRGKLAGTLVRKTIFCVSLGVFAFALASLLILLWGYYVSQREYAQINDEYVVIGTATAPENSTNNSDTTVDISVDGADEDSNAVPFLDITVDERKLKALNEDYAFYIIIPGTNIQYPVVQGEDNNHYLRYTYSNQENTAGSIQADYRTDRDTYLQTFNTIIHGHNRQDGTMFSDLAYYIDESFRDENPYIYIVLDDKEYVYEIFAFYEMEPVAVCYNPNTEDATYLSFIKENNTYTGGIEVTLEDHIISLYTCNDDSSMRYLVHAVLREIYDLS